jgi:hypothetical protein
MKKKFYIDYPQEHVEGKSFTYRCTYCKVITTTINGRLEGHLASCPYRKQQENKGYEIEGLAKTPTSSACDEVD